ncbi:uncharacterized protein RAG0_13818 [Rhynchosporium agropyri]|uniref:Uncharacterized protein n=2 Tax=Rhynchosporium TaxID=38037 RepID=A0A1E1MNJ3_RHYSE|nr:uncharacterized protein RAG0_13818 [Rhynchosporium agropyri]CZT50667.1 uncharacterized protein RSE6_11692 [Rhynchosporium secalis]
MSRPQIARIRQSSALRSRRVQLTYVLLSWSRPYWNKRVQVQLPLVKKVMLPFYPPHQEVPREIAA